MDDYKATVAGSWKELTVKEKIAFKETDSFKKLDEVVTPEDELVVKLANYITVKVHNPKAEQTDYNQYIVVADDGETYVTSSDTFDRSISDKLDDIADAGAEMDDWALKIYKRESKNFKGKYFLSCSII